MEQNKNLLIWILAGVAALIFLFGSLGMGGYGMMGFGMGYGIIFMLLFWGALIWLAVTLVNAAQSQKGGDTALSILKRRYASGEITKKQFEETKKKIEK